MFSSLFEPSNPFALCTGAPRRLSSPEKCDELATSCTSKAKENKAKEKRLYALVSLVAAVVFTYLTYILFPILGPIIMGPPGTTIYNATATEILKASLAKILLVIPVAATAFCLEYAFIAYCDAKDFSKQARLYCILRC